MPTPIRTQDSHTFINMHATHNTRFEGSACAVCCMNRAAFVRQGQVMGRSLRHPGIKPRADSLRTGVKRTIFPVKTCAIAFVHAAAIALGSPARKQSPDPGLPRGRPRKGKGRAAPSRELSPPRFAGRAVPCRLPPRRHAFPSAGRTSPCGLSSNPIPGKYGASEHMRGALWRTLDEALHQVAWCKTWTHGV